MVIPVVDESLMIKHDTFREIFLGLEKPRTQIVQLKMSITVSSRAFQHRDKHLDDDSACKVI